MNHLNASKKSSVKGIKVKHAISLTLLLVLGIWFHYQIKNSRINSLGKHLDLRLGRKGNVGPSEGFEMDFNDGIVTVDNGDDDSQLQDFLKHDESQIQDEIRIENLENDMAINSNFTQASVVDNVGNSKKMVDGPSEKESDGEKESKYDAEENIEEIGSKDESDAETNSKEENGEETDSKDENDAESDLKDENSEETETKDENDAEAHSKYENSEERETKDESDAETQSEEEDAGEIDAKEENGGETKVKDENDEAMNSKDEDDGEINYKEENNRELELKEENDAETQSKDEDDGKIDSKEENGGETESKDENEAETNSMDGAEETDGNLESKGDVNEKEDTKLFQDQNYNNSGSNNTREVHIKKINNDEENDSSMQANGVRNIDDGKVRGTTVDTDVQENADEELKSEYSGISDLQK